MLKIRLLTFVFLLLPYGQASAVTIETINISTVFGYGEAYYPGSFNRFGLLGVPLTYELSNGEIRVPGAGWIPYTNGTLAREEVTPEGTVEYQFGSINNWALGDGVLFYHLGQVWDYGSDGLWTEGALVPASDLILRSQAWSTTATMEGFARVIFNNPSNGWGPSDLFVPYAVPEGAIVPFSATYTLLDGQTWTPGIFDRPFAYNLEGYIDFASVPEPSSLLLLSSGLAGLTLLTFWRRARQGQILHAGDPRERSSGDCGQCPHP